MSTPCSQQADARENCMTDGKSTRKREKESHKRGESMRQAKPWVKPGEPLEFVRDLKKRGAWPPRKAKDDRPKKGRAIATPYLVIPAAANDLGTRPISEVQAFNNANIQIIDAAQQPVDRALTGQSYQLKCKIWNRGAAGAYGGMAEFYVGPPDLFSQLAHTRKATKALGYAGFVAMPGGSAECICPNLWTPADDVESRFSIVVHAYDPFGDRLLHPFNPRNDRHVGWRDYMPDFSGVWDGMESANQIHQVATRIRIIIMQSGFSVTVGFYMEVGAGIPTTPQDTATGFIFQNRINLASAESIGGAPFTTNQWELRLTSSGQLHFEHYRQFVAPNDTRPDTHTNGDLTRL